MTLIRWNPIKNLSRWPFDLPANVLPMRNDFDAIDNLFGSFREWFPVEDSGAGIWPRVDVVEQDVKFLVTMELPGVEKKDVIISVADDVLTVKGEKRNRSEAKDSSVRRFERSYGSFERSFTLPTAAKPDAIEAEFTEGVLTITIPKAEEVVPKQIDVRIK
jgi:HSP20 family protein